MVKSKTQSQQAAGYGSTLGFWCLFWVAASSGVCTHHKQSKIAARWKEKALSASGSVSGAASVLGSWQICHNVCLGIIAVLAVLGIAVTGMPLFFLTKIAIPMWTIAFILLLITGTLYYTKRCFSRNLLLLNSGLILAGVPFSALARFQYFFWAAGGALAVSGILLYLKERREKRKCH